MFPGRLLSFWLILSCLVLAGCPAKTSPGDGDGGRGLKLGPGQPCSVDLECGESLRCESRRRVCVCTSDLACPEQKTCDPFTGLCVQDKDALGCGSNESCQAGQWCDVVQRTCKPLRSFCEPCVAEPECGEGSCRGGHCSVPCTVSSDCPWSTGVACVGGWCVPETSCVESAPCQPDRGSSCRDDRDCADYKGQRCATGLGICVAIQSGCQVGQVCDETSLSCRFPCDSDDSCPMDETCMGCERGGGCTGFCAAIPTCRSDNDCTLERVCRFEPGADEGHCIPSCRVDDDCPIGEICRRQANRWVCKAGCVDNGDCALDEICDRASGVCVGGGGRCQISETCGLCEFCGPDDRCRASGPGGFCAPCVDDRECGFGGLCEDGHCLVACPEKGCPVGFFCDPTVKTPEGDGKACRPQGGTCASACG